MVGIPWKRIWGSTFLFEVKYLDCSSRRTSLWYGLWRMRRIFVLVDLNNLAEAIIYECNSFRSSNYLISLVAGHTAQRAWCNHSFIKMHWHDFSPMAHYNSFNSIHLTSKYVINSGRDLDESSEYSLIQLRSDVDFRTNQNLRAARIDLVSASNVRERHKIGMDG